MKIVTDKKGLSPVVATIILCGVVLIVGISTWSYTYMVSNSLQTSYYEGVQRQIDTISERFIVEHVAYDNSTNNLNVWVYNYGNASGKYGDIGIMVVVSVWENGNLSGQSDWFTILSGELVEITVSPNPAPSAGSELIVKADSRRGNVAYQTYVVPIAES